MTFTFSTEDEATNWAITWLRERGYTVRLPAKAEAVTPRQLRERLGLKATALTQRLKSPACPHFDGEMGPSGRILSIAPNPELLTFLSQPLQPGKARETWVCQAITIV